MHCENKSTLVNFTEKRGCAVPSQYDRIVNVRPNTVQLPMEYVDYQSITTEDSLFRQCGMTICPPAANDSQESNGLTTTVEDSKNLHHKLSSNNLIFRPAIDCSSPEICLKWDNDLTMFKGSDVAKLFEPTRLVHFRQRSLPSAKPPYGAAEVAQIQTNQYPQSNLHITSEIHPKMGFIQRCAGYNLTIDVRIQDSNGKSSTDIRSSNDTEYSEVNGQTKNDHSQQIGSVECAVMEFTVDAVNRTNSTNAEKRGEESGLIPASTESLRPSRTPSLKSYDTVKINRTPQNSYGTSKTQTTPEPNNCVKVENFTNPHLPPSRNSQSQNSAISHNTIPVILQNGQRSSVNAKSMTALGMSLSLYEPGRTRPTDSVSSPSTSDLPHLIQLLQSSETEVVVSASGYLQHLVYRNPYLKELTRQFGGIIPLVQLVYSENPQICQNAVGVLRNLTCGNNTEIKEELERLGGIRALAWLFEKRQVYWPTLSSSLDSRTPADDSTRNSTEPTTSTSQSILESAAAVLCNMSSVNHLKQSVLHEAVLPTLVSAVIRPTALKSVLHNDLARTITNEPPFITVVFRNVAVVLRNVSSSETAEVRESMRHCPSLLWSLITILHSAVLLQCSDTKTVEHCICTLRNLCYSIHNVSPPKHQSPRKNNGSTTGHGSPGIPQSAQRCRSTSKHSAFRTKLQENPPDSGSSILHETATLRMIVDLLQFSSNPSTIEASAGTIQNLAASNCAFSEIVREKLRELHCLPLLVELLCAPARKVAVAASDALRNLAIEDKSCMLLGKYGMPRILSALNECTTRMVISTESGINETASDWQLPKPMCNSSSLIAIGLNQSIPRAQSVYSARSVATALLSLCCTLVHQRTEHARRFVALGGVDMCHEILSVTDFHTWLAKSEATNESNADGRVAKLAIEMLQLLWTFEKLRPIYKLAGWKGSDFRVSKSTSRLSNFMHRRQKSVLLTLKNKSLTTPACDASLRSNKQPDFSHCSSMTGNVRIQNDVVHRTTTSSDPVSAIASSVSNLNAMHLNEFPKNNNESKATFGM